MAVYTPKDSDNYESVEVEISVKVEKEEIESIAKPEETVNKSQETNVSVSTNDPASLMLWSVGILLSCMGIYVLAMKKRKENK